MPPTTQSLYDPKFEHDACGVGFVANVNGRREHRILAYALQALGSLAHRGALDVDASTGNGCGVLTQIPQAFFQREAEHLPGRPKISLELAVGTGNQNGTGIKAGRRRSTAGTQGIAADCAIAA